jgi:hypothetical protein
MEAAERKLAMTKRLNLVSSLYKIARIANDVSTLASGDPKRITRRLVNKFIGRKIASKLYLRR